MDRETLGNALFLTSLALVIGCAEGSTGPGPRPGPFAGSGDDNDDPAAPWTDPLETSGSPGSSDTDGGEDDGGWPSEGETGQISGSTGGWPSGDDGDSGVETSGAGGDEGGDYGSTGYGEEPPAPAGDPCPALAQLYASCNPDYLYENEIALCNQSRAQAQAISVACAVAHTEYLACLSTLDCGTLLQPEVPVACFLQGAATDLACSL